MMRMMGRVMGRQSWTLSLCISGFLLSSGSVVSGQVAIKGRQVHTMEGAVIENGVVVIRDGKISAVGRADRVQIPAGFRVLEASVVTPGLIDAHSTVGFSGIFNHQHDQDQLERSAPVQPQLRAIDAYNPREKLIDWVRSFGVTTLHTGHAPGELISGQTMVVKTRGDTVSEAVMVEAMAVAATLSQSARKSKDKSPGSRGKMMAMLRAELIKAGEYLEKIENAEEDKKPSRDLKLESLGRVLRQEAPLMVTAYRAQDIASALRLGREFDLRLWLDGASESYLLIDEIKAAGVPVILHPTMMRSVREQENASFETAGILRAAGIPVTLQSGYESYVPKTRVVLFEAGIAAANGLGFEGALSVITIDAAQILGIGDRVGSLAVGKDGDVALYDGDPFEYTTHCIGVVIEGEIVYDGSR